MTKSAALSRGLKVTNYYDRCKSFMIEKAKEIRKKGYKAAVVTDAGGYSIYAAKVSK